MLFVLLSLLQLGKANYSPSSGDDWTQFRPDFEPLPGSVDTVPFQFGIVVNPFVLNHLGDYEPPPHTSIQRVMTTTYQTSHETEAPKVTKTLDVHQIADGQIQRHGLDSDSDLDDEDDTVVKRFDEEDDCDDDFVSPVYTVSCVSDSALQMSLQDGILRDDKDRIGSIVGGRQFQFDGPIPQHGTIYAAGWSITDRGQLALGDSTRFYQCASGEFYNLYDHPIGMQCNPVTLDVVELIEC